MQDAGCRVQGARCRVQGAGCKVHGIGCRVQNAGCRVQGAECRVQGAWCRVQGAGCRVQGAGCRVQGCRVSGATPRSGAAPPPRVWSRRRMTPRRRAAAVYDVSIYCVSINWFWKVNSPTKLSTYCLQSLIRMLRWSMRSARYSPRLDSGTGSRTGPHVPTGLHWHTPHPTPYTPHPTPYTLLSASASGVGL